MNRKYSALIAVAMAFGLATALPAQELTVQQEQARLATLWNLNNSNALSIAQFVEKDSSIATIIDRDIALLEKDSEQARKQKASAEGFGSRIVPNFLKAVAVTSGSVAAVGGIFSVVASSAAYKVWNGSDSLAERIGFGFLGTIFGNYSEDSINTRMDYLTRMSPDKEYNKIALSFGVASPFVAAASLVLAGICKYTSGKNSAYRANNAAYIKAMQDQFERNQVIIAKLKQIKYDNGL